MGRHGIPPHARACTRCHRSGRGKLPRFPASFQRREPSVAVIHRIPNGPVRRGDCLHWPLDPSSPALKTGCARPPRLLRKASLPSPSIAGRSITCALRPMAAPLREPFCYRDERTVASKEAADAIIAPSDLYQRTGAIPLRINTIYQLLADRAAGIDPHAPWAMFPEYVLYWLSGRRVAEYTNASHTGLVNLEDRRLGCGPVPPARSAARRRCRRSCAPEPFSARCRARLPRSMLFATTQIIAPACHDTASAIAGIPADLSSTAYLCTGTWSLMGTTDDRARDHARSLRRALHQYRRRYRRACFHSLRQRHVALKQCMDGWAAQGAPGPSKSSSRSLPHAVPTRA